MATLIIPPELQFIDETGSPLAGGQLATLVPGTSVPKATYQDAAQTILNQNPVPLDTRGTCVVFGTGDYRLILQAQNGDQIFDQLSSTPLPAAAVSDVMLPVVGAPSLGQARDLMGVTAAIAAAVATVAVIAGPTGPQGAVGPAGAVGATGPTGPAGSTGTSGGATTEFLSTNPGWWIDHQTNFLVQWGFTATDGSGVIQINFPRPFAAPPLAVLPVPFGAWASVSGVTPSGFTCLTSSPQFPGGWNGSAQFYWVALGR